MNVKVKSFNPCFKAWNKLKKNQGVNREKPRNRVKGLLKINEDK